MESLNSRPPSGSADTGGSFWTRSLQDMLVQLSASGEQGSSGAEERKKAVAEARKRLGRWLFERPRSQVEEDVDLVRLLELLFDYAMNVPYAEWYGEPEELDTERCEALLQRLQCRPFAEDEKTLSGFRQAFHRLSREYRLSRQDKQNSNAVV